MTTKKTCFFITPIGEQNTPERKRADQIQRHILGPLLAQFYVVRADELPDPGSITHQIIELLYNADLVIADLTGANANVAYELAIRHAFNKISIHLVDRTDRIPFDLKGERTIVFDISDLDSIESCKGEISKVVTAIENGKVPYKSPVFRAIGAAAITNDERDAFLEKIVDQIDDIATDVTSIETAITFSDIDDIGKLRTEINNIEQHQYDLKRDLDNLHKDVAKILKKLS